MRGKEKIQEQKKDFLEGEIVEQWSKKRILIAGILLLLFFAGAAFAFSKTKEKAAQVLSASFKPSETSASPPPQIKIPTQQDAANLLNQAKQELNNITSSNSSSSTSASAIQKVIQDLQALQKGQTNATELICKTLCGK